MRDKYKRKLSKLSQDELLDCFYKSRAYGDIVQFASKVWSHPTFEQRVTGSLPNKKFTYYIDGNPIISSVVKLEQYMNYPHKMFWTVASYSRPSDTPFGNTTIHLERMYELMNMTPIEIFKGNVIDHIHDHVSEDIDQYVKSIEESQPKPTRQPRQPRKPRQSSKPSKSVRAGKVGVECPICEKILASERGLKAHRTRQKH